METPVVYDDGITKLYFWDKNPPITETNSSSSAAPSKTHDSITQVYERNAAIINLPLSDVVLPDMRRDELARRLNELQPSLPVLFMSGYTEKAVL